MLAVNITDPVGYEGLQRPPDQLRRLVAEKSLDRGAGQLDTPIIVDQHHRVGRGGEHGFEKRIGPLIHGKQVTPSATRWFSGK
jgi:hypothetical protein